MRRHHPVLIRNMSPEERAHYGYRLDLPDVWELLQEAEDRRDVDAAETAAFERGYEQGQEDFIVSCDSCGVAVKQVYCTECQ